MISAHFTHIRHWVFDLDNTLYAPQARLFDQIEARMTAWVAQTLGIAPAAADALRHEYWLNYGTTLAGLMERHAIDPAPYLAHVHDIDLAALSPDATLAARISTLPGRKIVYTNGTRLHAERVLAARGLEGAFDAVYGVEQAGLRPKPQRAAYEAIFALDGVSPETATMFEDDPRNLAAPFDMGMRTVHVAPAPHQAPHIHHHTDDLSGFLAKIIAPAPHLQEPMPHDA